MNRHSMVERSHQALSRKDMGRRGACRHAGQICRYAEMLLYRMTRTIAAVFGLEEMHFLRFSHRTSTEI